MTQVARFFVLQHGRDCDGFCAFSISCFATHQAAVNCHESQTEGSDGMYYELTADWAKVVDYCCEWNRDPIEETSFLADDIYVN